MINPVITIILLLLLGFLSPLLYKHIKVYFKILLIIVLTFNILELIIIIPAVSSLPLQVYMGNIPAPFGIMLTFGLTGTIIALMVNFIALCIVFFKLNKNKDCDNEMVFYTVFPILVAALISLANTQDIFNIFVFLEIVTISVYILAGLKKYKKTDLSVIKFITGTSIGALLMLTGIAALYALTGSLNIIHIHSILTGYAYFNTYLFNIAVFIILTGLMVEAYMFPFNIFVTDIYAHTQTINGAIYSGLVQSIVVFVMIKLIKLFIINPMFLNIMIVIGVVTIIFSQFAAFSEKNIRRMLGFSSFAQSGLIITIVALSLKSGIQNELFSLAIMMIIIHAISKFTMFLAADKFINENGSIINTRKAGQFSFFSFIIATLTLVGIPPFPGFYIKFRILSELLRINYSWMAVIIVISAFLEIVYLLKTARKFFLKNSNESNESLLSIFPAMLPLLIIFLFSVNPAYLYKSSSKMDFTEETKLSIQELKDTSILNEHMLENNNEE